jgi:hypothetical protein
MELATRSLIEELAQTEYRGPRRRRMELAPRFSTAATQQRRCKCGVCPACLDNARWDRIFNEKFADPNYYRKPEPRQGSSLSWLL